MELLGLNEEELCTVLDADPLTLLSGQLEHHRPELPILLELLAEPAAERAGPSVLRRWVGQASGPHGGNLNRRPACGATSPRSEDALAELASPWVRNPGRGRRGAGPWVMTVTR